ncbi:MAG: hypothetical protein HOY79_21905 [Streptomyces sp.]|nr:hypothetical protein [Streptomyces sp.]
MAFDDRHAKALGFLLMGAVTLGGLAMCSAPAGPPKPPPYTPYTFQMPSLSPYPGPVTVCRDGWVSHSTGRGTCSHHGGEG